MEDTKRYNGMEKCLQKINAECISLSPEEETRNNVILAEVIEPLINMMKETNPLFNSLYKKKFYGGSYYDGLKVGSPDEYDIDLLLKFPKKTKVEICTKETPGYVNLFLDNTTGYEKFCKDENWESYLDTKKVLSWMEGVIQTAFNQFSLFGTWYIFNGIYDLKVCYSKGGPAFTLNITGEIDDEPVNVFVDLVPCFLFRKEQWPEGFKNNPFEYILDMDEFFVVPKCPKGVNLEVSKYWRLSFQIQERRLIRDKGHVKPALRLLKKMRDNMQWKQISSYFLKTILLFEVDEEENDFWWDKPMSYNFMRFLIKLQECLSQWEILYFWHTRYNLLESARGDFINYSNRIQYIINDIERNRLTNPNKAVDYILNKEEKKKFFPELCAITQGCEHIIPQSAAIEQKPASSCCIL